MDTSIGEQMGPKVPIPGK